MGQLGPGGAVPGPGAVGVTRTTSHEDHVPGGRVVGHGRGGESGRGGGRGQLGPGGAVPGPSVIEVTLAAVAAVDAAEEDYGARGRDVGHGGAVAGASATRGLGPRGGGSGRTGRRVRERGHRSSGDAHQHKARHGEPQPCLSPTGRAE